jgi:hypothetical protein
VFDLMLNAKVQTILKLLNNAVKFVTAVSCVDVEKDLLNLIDENSVHTEGCPKMKVEDWSLVSSIWNLASVLTRRAHPPEPSQSLWQNDTKSLLPLRSVLPVTEVRFSDLMDPEVKQFKTTKKKPDPLSIDVKRHAKAIVVNFL